MAGHGRIEGGRSCKIDYRHEEGKKGDKDYDLCQIYDHDAKAKYVRVKYKYKVSNGPPPKYKTVNCWFKLDKNSSASVDWFEKKPKTGKACQ